jgi:hypothetical protein
LYFVDQCVDAVVWIEQFSDGGIVVQCVDDVGDVLAHAAADVVVAGEELFGLVNQVGGYDLVDDSFFNGFVEDPSFPL